MKKAAIALLCTLGAAFLAADEGMWRPGQLPALKSRLQQLGLQVDPATLAGLTNYPMNAVISLGGCTASFVSPEGLVITNHHCAFSSIQQNSTAEHNLLRDGFLARTKEEELPAVPGSRVLVMVAVTDVTLKIRGAVPAGATGLARFKAIERQEKALIAECEKDTGHRCSVRRYYGGLEHELVKQLEIRDVRLVHAPAESVGKYGGEIDNWMWPRHTGDYSFYRAYVGPDGKPADYSKQNVPYHPKYWLKVTAAGLKNGDFVMAAGYPAVTSRYRTSSEVKNTFEWLYPVIRREYLEYIALVEKLTANREDTRIQYASLLASLNNTAKNFAGLLEGYAKSDIVERKQALEKGLQAWIWSDAGRRQQFQSALDDLRRLVEESQADLKQTLYYSRFAQRSSLLGVAKTLYRLSKERQKPDAEREPGFQDRDITRLQESMKRISRSYDREVDHAVWRHFIIKYSKRPADQHVKEFDEWFGISAGRVNETNLEAKLNRMYEKTGLEDEAKRMAWMKAASGDFENSGDPFIQLAVKLYAQDMAAEEKSKDLAGRLEEARPRYMQALLAYYGSKGKQLYPDANGTLRVTFGTVQGYSPKDAVEYLPFTTLRGILEKDTGKEPFDAPKKELGLIREKKYGQYFAKAVDSVPVNFLTTLDSTGGNSGSPTMNGKGELVGLLFDGNFESIISDWDFLPAVTRTIHVDMRYVLWVMDNLYGASNLLREMGIEPQ